MIQNHDLATAPDRLAALVDQITTTLPGVLVLVATIPPLANPTWAPRAEAYNAALPGALAAATAGRPGVQLVDIHDAVTLDDLWDGIHPSADGYAAIANAWFHILRPLVVS
jgi:lysophospholipase L1-like esterase